MSLSIPTFQAADHTEWETSFNQILNRTKNNLNRINQRYAPSPIIENPIISDLPFTSNSINNINGMNTINNENMQSNNNQRTSLLEKKFTSAMSDTSSYLKPKMNYIDTSLYERVARLEENQRSSDSSIIHRISQLEKSLESINNTIDKSNIEMKDINRNVLQLQSRLNTTNGLMELLQNDNESKRLVITKMESWSRQGEIWREEIDGKIEIISKQMKSLDRTRVEQRDLISDYVTRYDLDTLKDRMSVITQQTVAASLSAWHDKMESSLREVERQVALLRIGRTNSNSSSSSRNQRVTTASTSNDSTTVTNHDVRDDNYNSNNNDNSGGVHYDEDALMTPEEVQIALSTPLPSELLLKGTVAHEVLQMESKLEEKLQCRLNLYIQNEFNQSSNKLNANLNQKLYSLCAEMGIEYDSTTAATYDESESFLPRDSNFITAAADPKESSKHSGYAASKSVTNGYSSSNNNKYDINEHNAKRARENYRIRLLESKQ
jgi:hypothetical protein